MTNNFYQNLLPFDQNTNFLTLMRNISTGIIETDDNPDSLFLYLNDLQRMRKFHHKLFLNTFNNVYVHIPNLMHSEHIAIAKVSLKFVADLFLIYEYETLINECIPTLLPVVLELSVSSIPTLKEEAMVALANMAYNMLYDETIFTLLGGIMNEDANIAFNATETLKLLFTNIDKYIILNEFYWPSIYKKVEEIYNSNNEMRMNLLGAVLFVIEKKLEDIWMIFSNNLSEDHVMITINLIELYKEKNIKYN